MNYVRSYIQTTYIQINYNVQAYSVYLYSNEDTGTPLTCAAKNGHEEIVDYLIMSEADEDGLFIMVRIAIAVEMCFCTRRHIV